MLCSDRVLSMVLVDKVCYGNSKNIIGLESTALLCNPVQKYKKSL